MKKFTPTYQFSILFFIAFFFTQCELVKEDEFEPYDIFEEENVDELTDGKNLDDLITDGEVVVLPVENICSNNRLFVNGERINANELGYKIKGTIFSESSIGNVAVTSGEFDLIRDAEGNVVSFEGYGNAQIPNAGFLNDVVVMADIYGSQTTYASTSLFKDDNPKLPFLDEQCYFNFNLDPIDNAGIEEGEAISSIRKSFFNFGSIFYNPTDPAVLFHGDVLIENVDQRQEQPDNNKAQPVDSKNSKTKKFKLKPGFKMISDVGVGISLNRNFAYTPLTFSDELEAKVGGTNFEPFNGSFYLSGRIPLGQYPLEFEGETVFYGGPSPLGILDLFSNGLDQGLYQQGVNGKLFFDHALLSVFPTDLSMELGRASLQLNANPNNPFLRFAGEYDIDPLAFFSKLLGESAVQYFPSIARTGQMYVSVGKLEDWEFYMMNDIQLRIAGLDNQSLSKSYFHFTPEQIEIGGETNLPFGLAGIEVKGYLQNDGSFLLSGNANVDVDFGDGVSLNGDLTLEISNQGAFLSGDLTLPGAVAGISVKGHITKDEIYLEGEGNVNITFGPNATLASNLHVKASSSEGIFIDGFLKTPMQVAEVAVSGEISARGLALSGMISGKLDYGLAALQSNLALDASTWGGAKLSGMIDVPLQIIGGELEAYGEILTANTFKLGASTRVTLGFEGFASVSPMVNFAFSQDEIEIAAEAEFCAIEACATAGLKFNPNWATGDVEICVTPFAVELCL